MPFHSQIGQQSVAASDEPTARHTGAVQPATTRSAHERYQEERLPSMGDSWPFPPAAFPTDANIRYAHELRLHVRRGYLARPTPPSSPWCVGVD
jgi:hypothetical protein